VKPSLALALLLPASAWATTLANNATTTFDALATRAQAAAHLRVVSQTSRFEGTRIVTDSTCEVVSAAFGAAEGSIVTITSLGGFVGNIGQKVDGLERPMPGEELAVLLGADGYMGGGHRVVGFSLGLYRVIPVDSLTLTDAPLLGQAQDTSRVAREGSVAPLTLGEFLQRAKLAHGH